MRETRNPFIKMLTPEESERLEKLFYEHRKFVKSKHTEDQRQEVIKKMERFGKE